MIKVLVLNGVARSGKDTFADAISGRASENGYGCMSLSTVDLVKSMLELAGIDKNKKDDKDRKLMSDLKDLLTEHSNIPFNNIVSKIQDNDVLGVDSIFMVMCREPEEIQKFKDFFGNDCVTIIIKRPDIDVPNNHADQNVNEFEYDVEVSNSGTVQDLHAIAMHVCDTVFDE